MPWTKHEASTGHYIGTEHLLIGLMREGEGVAAGVLESLGIDLEKIRNEIDLVLLQAQSQDHSNENLRERILELSPSEFQELVREYMKANFSNAEIEITIKMKA